MLIIKVLLKLSKYTISNNIWKICENIRNSVLFKKNREQICKK